MVVSIVYNFYAKKYVITRKNDEMKISKEKRKLSTKKWRSGEVLVNLHIIIFRVPPVIIQMRFSACM